MCSTNEVLIVATNRQYFYWYLTAEGIEYLREYLHLPEEIVPATLKKSASRPARPGPAPGGEEENAATPNAILLVSCVLCCCASSCFQVLTAGGFTWVQLFLRYIWSHSTEPTLPQRAKAHTTKTVALDASLGLCTFSTLWRKPSSKLVLRGVGGVFHASCAVTLKSYIQYTARFFYCCVRQFVAYTWQEACLYSTLVCYTL